MTKGAPSLFGGGPKVDYSGGTAWRGRWDISVIDRISHLFVEVSPGNAIDAG